MEVLSDIICYKDNFVGTTSSKKVIGTFPNDMAF